MQMPTDTASPLVTLYRTPGVSPGPSHGRDEDEHGRVGSHFLQALNGTEQGPPSATPSGAAEAALDILNPLQHLPGVSTLYRSATGDEISAPSRLIGGALFGSLLFGGPVGLGFALANVMSEDMTGRDLGENALAMLGVEAPARAQAPAQALTQMANKAPAENKAGNTAENKNEETKGTPDEGAKDALDNGAKGVGEHLAHHLDVKRWAEEEARFRTAEAAQAQARLRTGARGAGESKTAEATLTGQLMAGVMHAEILSAAKQYGHAARLAGDTMPAAFDLES